MTCIFEIQVVEAASNLGCIKKNTDSEFKTKGTIAGSVQENKYWHACVCVCVCVCLRAFF